MAILKNITSGESLSIVLIYPEGYDVTRIVSQKLYIGYNSFTPSEFNGTYRVELKSTQTGGFSGKMAVRLWLDDEQFGLRKPLLGELLFEQSKADSNNDSVNHGADIVLSLNMDESIISVDHALYEYFRCFSPYEIAVQNGYEGTEPEFNEQLGSFKALYDGAIEAKEDAEAAAGTAATSAQEAAGSAIASAAAKDLSIAAKNLSESAAGLALISEQNAETSASDAQSAASAAHVAKEAAETAKDLSEKWASNPEDEAVADSKYSSLHYAAKAAISETNAAISAGNAATSEQNASGSESAADLSAQNAAASEQAAGISETNAGISAAAALESEQNAQTLATDTEGYANAAVDAKEAAETAKGLAEAARDKSIKWADEAENIPVEPGKYSSKHWAAKAGKLSTPFANWYSFHVESAAIRDAVKSVVVTGAESGYVYFIQRIYRNHASVNEQIYIYKRKLSDGTETFIYYDANVASTGIQEVKYELAGRNEVFYVTIDFDKIPDGSVIGANEIKMVINPECYSYKSYTEGIATTIAKAYSDNWPYLADVVPTVNGSSLTVKQMQEFFLDMYISGTYNSAKNYSINLLRRNYSGHWVMYLYADNDIVSVYDVTSNPEEGDKITIHTLAPYNSSGITVKVAVNWTKITAGVAYTGMSLAYKFTLDPRCWDLKNCPIIYPYEIDLIASGFSSSITNIQNSIIDLTRKIPTKAVINNTSLVNGAVQIAGGVKVPAGQTGYNTYFNAPLQWASDKLFTEYSGKYIIATYIYLLSGSEITNFDAHIYGGGIVGGGQATAGGKVIDSTNKILYVTYPKFIADPAITANQYIQLKGNTPVANDFTITLLGVYVVEENAAAKNQKQIAVGTEVYRTQKQILYELQNGDGLTMMTNLVKSLAPVTYTQKTVKRYGTSGVDADFCGLNAIGDALASITDASELNRYKILVEGIFHFTDPLDVTYREPLFDEPTVINGKDWIDIEGVGRNNTVIAMEFSPESIFHSGKVYTDYQPVMWNCNSKLSNMSIIGKYCRYAVHFEGGNLVTNKTLNFENLYILGKDNLNTIGTGMRDGQVWNFKQCTIISETGSAFGMHSALSDVVRGGEVNFNQCIFYGNLFFNSYPNNRGININLVECTFNKIPILSYDLYYTNRARSADYSDIKIRATSNPVLFDNRSTKGKGLRIKSATTGVNSIVTIDPTCSAFNLIVGDSTKTVEDKTNWLNKKRWGYEFKNGGVGLSGYAIGHIDVDESNTAITNGLGVKLGDCSIVNKVLILTIDGGEFQVTFNENYTSRNNTYVLAIINAAIGAAGTADVYNISQSYYPDFADMQNKVNGDTTAILGGMGVIFTGNSMRIATNADNRIDGICLYDTVIGEMGRCITSGYIYSMNYAGRVKTLEVNNNSRTVGVELGISASSPGVFDPAASPKLLIAVDTNILKFI